jgi:hypothetical protein
MYALDSNPLTEKISSSLFVETARLLAVVNNSRQTPKDRMWTSEDKVLGLTLMKSNPKSYILLQTLVLMVCGRTLQFVISTAYDKTGINDQVFGALVLCTFR